MDHSKDNKPETLPHSTKEPSKETLFNFVDDSNEDYEFVLPPECEIRQECRSDDAGSFHEEEEKRVSFDTSRNEYFTVERHNSDPENSFFEADDELQTDETEGVTAGLQNLKVTHQVPNEAGNETEQSKLEILNQIETKISACTEEKTASKVSQQAIELSEYISKISIPADRLADILVEETNHGHISSDEGSLSSESITPNPGCGVVIENIPSLKDNPFIMKDKMERQ